MLIMNQRLVRSDFHSPWLNYVLLTWQISLLMLITKQNRPPLALCYKQVLLYTMPLKWRWFHCYSNFFVSGDIKFCQQRIWCKMTLTSIFGKGIFFKSQTDFWSTGIHTFNLNRNGQWYRLQVFIWAGFSVLVYVIFQI